MYDILKAASLHWEKKKRGAADMEALRKVTEFVETLVPNGMHMQNCVLFIDMQEIEQMEKMQIPTRNENISWKTLKFILCNFRREKPLYVSDKQPQQTPSLNRFGVSTRSKVMRLCRWRFMKNIADGGDLTRWGGRPMREFKKCAALFIFND